jgi:hypothetical protein
MHLHEIPFIERYCQGAPPISASFAEMGGNTMSLFFCRINKVVPKSNHSIKAILQKSLFALRRLNHRLEGRFRLPAAIE